MIELQQFTTPDSTRNNRVSTPEAEKRYREELTRKVVAESVGSVAFHTSIDLSSEEKNKLNATLAERSVASGSEKPSHQAPEAGGWDNYGDVPFEAIELLPEQQELRTLGSRFNDHEHPERVLFFKDNEGKDVVLYERTGLSDAMGRPNNVVSIAFQVSPETAKELVEDARKDPSIFTDIAIAQTQAIGMGEDRTDKYFQFALGPDRNRHNNRWYDQSVRSLAIRSLDENGEPINEDVMFRDKQPLLDSYTLEDSSVAPAETYDITENIAASELRSQIDEMQRRGLSHLDIMLSLKSDGSELGTDAEIAQVKAYDTVYGELTQQPVNEDELKALGMTDQNRTEVERELREEIEGTIEFFNPDGTRTEQIISVLESEMNRYWNATDEIEDSSLLGACMLKCEVFGEIMEELQKKQSQER